MPRVPLIGRLYYREYVAVVFGFLFLGFEAMLRLAIFFLPNPVIHWFRDQTRKLFHKFATYRVHVKSSNRKGDVAALDEDDEEEVCHANTIRKAVDFEDLCKIYGYDFEEHVVQTEDGYLLGLHRIPRKRGEGGREGSARSAQASTHPGARLGRPVVYLHHGLLMSSDVFLCTTSAERSLPLVLANAGYDVWLGNNRGNKYSKKHTTHPPYSQAFWNFSIDDFARRDIPDSIAYILEVTGEKSLSYIGFSQGSAQAFAALSICPALNAKIDVFVALAPAMSPPGLSAPLVDGLMKASPTLMYLFFGRRSILSSASMWQSILYPPIFASVIDSSLRFLFNWSGDNISPTQKIAAYAHLYSTASTKSVVHWFQIMRNAAFQMYDDDVQSLSPGSRDGWGNATTRFYYRPARFPTRNIAAPVVLLYGTNDSLVDIDVMMKQLPGHARAKALTGYEHVDILWGRHVDRDVIPEVLKTLREYARIPSKADHAKPQVNGRN